MFPYKSDHFVIKACLALFAGLKKFVDCETSKYYDDLATERIEAAKEGSLDVDDVVKFWELAFKNEYVEYAEPVATTDEELFSVVYHKLVHSPALETILQAEQAYAETARTVANKRTEQIAALSERSVFVGGNVIDCCLILGRIKIWRML